MPFQRDSLQTLIERTRADIKSKLGISGAIVRRSAADIVATVWAGAVHLEYGSLEWLSRQLFVATAEREALIRRGSLYGISPNAAMYATGAVIATGVDTTLIPTGTIFVRDDAARFESTADATITGGSATVPVQAVLAGVAGNTEDNAELLLESPIAGVNDTVNADTPGFASGADEEATEAFRGRLEEFFASDPAGGSDSDYEVWSREVAGVTRVWVFSNTPALGQVTVLFVRDDESPILPDAGEIATVQAYLDERRPSTAEVIAAAPTELVLPFTISITPDTTANRAAVEAELDDLVRTKAEAGDGAGRGTIFISQVYAAVGRAPLDDFTVSAPVADTIPAQFELITRGAVTWV